MSEIPILTSLASLWVPAAALLALPAVLALARRRLELEAPESLVLACALALAWCMGGGMLLGAAGWLRAEAVWLWLAAGAAASVAAGWRAGVSWSDWRASFEGWSGLALLVVPLLVLLAMATVPPWYRDSLVYHLALPRDFAQHGGVFWPDDNIFAAFPSGWEMALSLLYALGTDAEPVFNPRLAGAWVAGGAALSTVALSRAAGASRPLAAAGGALLLLLPTVVEFGPSAYVEGGLLFWVGLALWATLRGRPWWLSAVFAGVACWVKYPGLAVVAFLACAASLLECLRADERNLAAWAKRAAQWGALALAIGCPFLLRNALARGNPFFPTAYSLFGGEGWDPWRAWAYGVTLNNYGFGRDFADYVLLPWRLFTQRGFDGGFEGSLGPLIALGALLGAWEWWAGDRRRFGVLLAWVLWGGMFWALTVQQTRFFLFVTPALIAMLVAALPQRRSWAVAAALLAVQVGWSAGPVTKLWNRQATSQWLAGDLDADAFLSRMLPESYRPMQELAAHVPEDGRVWLVWMRGYTYYLDRPYRMDCVFEAWRLEELLDEAKTPGELVAGLHDAGITHLLVNHRFFLKGDNADLRPGRTKLLRTRFVQALGTRAVEPVEAWGPVTLYSVAELLNSDELAGAPR